MRRRASSSLAFRAGVEKGKQIRVHSVLKQGRYAVSEVFAYGGMGVILRARDRRIFNNEVLIKGVKYQASEFAFDKQRALYNIYQLRQMLRREYRILCELRDRGINNIPHPNDFFYDINPELGQRYPFGRLELTERHSFLGLDIHVDQEPYLVMERIDGVPMGKQIEALSPTAVITAVRDVLLLLEKMHRSRRRDDGSTLCLLYLDLKPDNILMDARGLITLIDFGGVMPIVNGATRKEQRGALTHGYAAPELGGMFSGRRAVDGRADLYSAGAILWRAFADIDPIRLADPTTNPFPELTPSSLPQDLGPSTRELVAKALARDPDKRWQNAAQMAEACDQAIRETRDRGSHRGAAGN